MMARPASLIGAFAAVISILTPASVSAAPQAIVRLAPSDRQQYCTAPAKRMVVAVLDGDKELANEEFCALDGKMSAQLFTDHRGKTYAVARTGDRYDPNAEFVRVLQLTRFRDVKNTHDVYNLGEFAAVALRPPSGGAPATYRVVDTDAGGLELVVDYPIPKPEPYALAPIKQVAIRLGP